MELNFSMNGIVEGTKSTCSSVCTMAQTGASKAYGFSVSTAQKSYALGVSVLDKTVALIQSLWSATQPALAKSFAMLRSPLGICGMAATGATLLATQSHRITNSYVRQAAPIAAIGLACLAGLALGQTGLIPAAYFAG